MNKEHIEIAEALRKLITNGIKPKHSTRSQKFDNVIHVTDLYDFCARRYVLAQRHKIAINVDKKFPPAMNVTFRLGQKMETMVLESLQSCLFGDFSTCPTCGTIRYNPPLFQYSVGDFIITGHVDAVVSYGDKLFILEIKSMDKDQFNNLTEPSLKYMWQLMSYLYLKKKKRIKDISDVGFLVYLSKGYNTKPVKVFPIEMDTPFLRHIRGVMRELKTLSKRKLPKRICTTDLYPLAKECPVKDICFGRRKK